jgi:hypothetical protein
MWQNTKDSVGKGLIFANTWQYFCSRLTFTSAFLWGFVCASCDSFEKQNQIIFLSSRRKS